MCKKYLLVLMTSKNPDSLTMAYENLTSGKFISSHQSHYGYGMHEKKENRVIFGLMRMPSHFPLGQLYSPTTGIFRGQIPAIHMYTKIHTAAPRVRFLCCMLMQMMVCKLSMLCMPISILSARGFYIVTE